MAASRQEVYFMAIRMQTGAIRRELPLIGVGERAQRAVMEALDRVEARVREWGVSGQADAARLEGVLASLMALPGTLRTLVESGCEEANLLAVAAELGRAASNGP